MKVFCLKKIKRDNCVDIKPKYWKRQNKKSKG